jgi:DNA-binding NarL/FixJ family response regulator
MLTASGRNDELFGALRAGADGYLLMTTSPQRLPYAIRGVVNGEAALPREFTAQLIQEFRDHGNRRRLALSMNDEAVELTAREFEVLERLRKRERTSEVAAQLGISEVTVRRHISSVLQKLGAPNREAVIQLLERPEPSVHAGASD